MATWPTFGIAWGTCCMWPSNQTSEFQLVCRLTGIFCRSNSNSNWIWIWNWEGAITRYASVCWKHLTAVRGRAGGVLNKCLWTLNWVFFYNCASLPIKQGTNIFIVLYYHFQWRIQDFPEGVANLLFGQFFPKTAWKWRNFVLGAHVLRAPLDPAITSFHP